MLLELFKLLKELLLQSKNIKAAKASIPVKSEIDNSLTDFIQRFRGLNETRQDKLGQLDPAIIEMINKLYT